ncbi:MAG: ParB/RepB/Spo0J family partition protein [Anaerolineae bacterium]|nr:ParB/RepB/Spo0J family partition protein [Anaerolineae bacterium]
METKVIDIPLEQIRPGDNDRTEFGETELWELAESIAEHGLAQPITVRRRGEGYEIVAGERRYRAHLLLAGASRLERATIPAIVREYDDEQAAAIMLAENVQRADLNPIDEARAYQKRVERWGWSTGQAAEKAKVSLTRVRSRLELLKLAPEVQEWVRLGIIPLGHAAELGVLDCNRQRMAVAWLREQAALPTRAAFARVVGEMYAAQVQDGLFDLALFGGEVQAAIEESGTGQLMDILPRSDSLPPLPNVKSSVGYILDDYVAELLRSGHRQEAAVLMDFWVKLQGANVGRIPPIESKTLATWLETQGGK